MRKLTKKIDTEMKASNKEEWEKKERAGEKDGDAVR